MEIIGSKSKCINRNRPVPNFPNPAGANNLDFRSPAVFFGILNKILLFLMQMGECVV